MTPTFRSLALTAVIATVATPIVVWAILSLMPVQAGPVQSTWALRNPPPTVEHVATITPDADAQPQN